MTNIFVLMPIYNEESRYLNACLDQFVDSDFKVYVYDDRSTDRSVEIAKEYDVTVWQREEGLPSFLENESSFRGEFWRKFKAESPVEEGDWILSLDADEILFSPEDDPFYKILDIVEDDFTYAIKKHEIFRIVGDRAFKRMDGAWDREFTPRLFSAGDGDKWPNGTMGCGSLPVYAMRKNIRVMREPSIMHLGYAAEKDRMAKYQRYIDRPGHNLDHIRSILSKPTLKEIEWKVPISVWGYLNNA